MPPELAAAAFAASRLRNPPPAGGGAASGRAFQFRFTRSHPPVAPRLVSETVGWLLVNVTLLRLTPPCPPCSVMMTHPSPDCLPPTGADPSKPRGLATW